MESVIDRLIHLEFLIPEEQTQVHQAKRSDGHNTAILLVYSMPIEPIEK